MNTCSLLEDQEDLFFFVVGMAEVLMKPQTKHMLLLYESNPH